MLGLMMDRVFLDLQNAGFALVHGVALDELLPVAERLGIPKGDRRERAPVRAIRPQGESVARPNTLSSRYGTGAFPFHTDAAYWPEPPRWLILYCENPGEGGRQTLLVDSWMWRLSKSEAMNLSSEIWRTRDGQPFLCTLTCRRRNQPMIRFDQACMKPLTSRARAGSDILGTAIVASEQTQIDWRIGDLLVIDNWRVLHARSGAERPDPQRSLLRILVEEKTR
jgi:hypothetical protein